MDHFLPPYHCAKESLHAIIRKPYIDSYYFFIAQLRPNIAILSAYSLDKNASNFVYSRIYIVYRLKKILGEKPRTLLTSVRDKEKGKGRGGKAREGYIEVRGKGPCIKSWLRA